MKNRILNLKSKKEIIFGKLKLENARIKYDPATRQLITTGTAILNDQNGNALQKNDFELFGSHEENSDTLYLNTNTVQKFNSDNQILVRAKATCLNQYKPDQFDCSKAVIDFFAKYQNKLYTEQMELTLKLPINKPENVKPTELPNPKSKPNENQSTQNGLVITEITDTNEELIEVKNFIPSNPSAHDENNNTTDSKTEANTIEKDEDGLQKEGSEKATLGRYQGFAETIDINSLFKDDNASNAPSENQSTAPEATPATTATTPTTPVITPKPANPSTEPSKPNTTTAPNTQVKPEDKKPVVKPKPPTQPPTPPVPAPVVQEPAKPKDSKNSGSSTSTPDTKSSGSSTSVPPSALPQPDNKNKNVNPDILQLEDGNLRPINQAVNSADIGSLRNATSMLLKQQQLDKKAFFELAWPTNNKFFGTYEVGEMIVRLGEFYFSSVGKKLNVGNLSRKNGGQMPPHASHQNGTDVDFAYPSISGTNKFPSVIILKNNKYSVGDISIENTFELLKFAFKQTDLKVDRIFSDKRIIKSLCEYAKSINAFNSDEKDIVNRLFDNIEHVHGHGDHIHLRLKCSTYDVKCRHKLYNPVQNCKI